MKHDLVDALTKAPSEHLFQIKQILPLLYQASAGLDISKETQVRNTVPSMIYLWTGTGQ